MSSQDPQRLDLQRFGPVVAKATDHILQSVPKKTQTSISAPAPVPASSLPALPSQVSGIIVPNTNGPPVALHSGMLKKRARIGWSSQFFVLTKEALLYYSNPKDHQKGAPGQLLATVKSLSQITHDKDCISFSISKAKPTQLMAANPADAAAWCGKLLDVWTTGDNDDQRPRGGGDGDSDEEMAGGIMDEDGMFSKTLAEEESPKTPEEVLAAKKQKKKKKSTEGKTGRHKTLKPKKVPAHPHPTDQDITFDVDFGDLEPPNPDGQAVPMESHSRSHRGSMSISSNSSSIAEGFSKPVTPRENSKLSLSTSFDGSPEPSVTFDSLASGFPATPSAPSLSSVSSSSSSSSSSSAFPSRLSLSSSTYSPTTAPPPSTHPQPPPPSTKAPPLPVGSSSASSPPTRPPPPPVENGPTKPPPPPVRLSTATRTTRSSSFGAFELVSSDQTGWRGGNRAKWETIDEAEFEEAEEDAEPLRVTSSPADDGSSQLGEPPVVDRPSLSMPRGSKSAKVGLQLTSTGLPHSPSEISIQDCLDDKEGSSLMRKFSEEVTHDTENLDFLDEVARYQTLVKDGNAAEAVKQAGRICEQFVSESGAKQLNFNSQLRGQLLKMSRELTPETLDVAVFDEAMKEVKLLLATNSFQRFKKTPPFTIWATKMSSRNEEQKKGARGLEKRKSWKLTLTQGLEAFGKVFSKKENGSTEDDADDCDKKTGNPDPSSQVGSSAESRTAPIEPIVQRRTSQPHIDQVEGFPRTTRIKSKDTTLAPFPSRKASAPFTMDAGDTDFDAAFADMSMQSAQLSSAGLSVTTTTIPLPTRLPVPSSSSRTSVSSVSSISGPTATSPPSSAPSSSVGLSAMKTSASSLAIDSGKAVSPATSPKHAHAHHVPTTTPASFFPLSSTGPASSSKPASIPKPGSPVMTPTEDMDALFSDFELVKKPNAAQRPNGPNGAQAPNGVPASSGVQTSNGVQGPPKEHQPPKDELLAFLQEIDLASMHPILLANDIRTIRTLSLTNITELCRVGISSTNGMKLLKSSKAKLEGLPSSDRTSSPPLRNISPPPASTAPTVSPVVPKPTAASPPVSPPASPKGNHKAGTGVQLANVMGNIDWIKELGMQPTPEPKVDQTQSNRSLLGRKGPMVGTAPPPPGQPPSIAASSLSSVFPSASVPASVSSVSLASAAFDPFPPAKQPPPPPPGFPSCTSSGSSSRFPPSACSSSSASNVQSTHNPIKSYLESLGIADQSVVDSLEKHGIKTVAQLGTCHSAKLKQIGIPMGIAVKITHSFQPSS